MDNLKCYIFGFRICFHFLHDIANLQILCQEFKSKEPSEKKILLCYGCFLRGVFFLRHPVYWYRNFHKWFCNHASKSLLTIVNRLVSYLVIYYYLGRLAKTIFMTNKYQQRIQLGTANENNENYMEEGKRDGDHPKCVYCGLGWSLKFRRKS